VLVNVGSFTNVFELRDLSQTQGSRVQLSGEYRLKILHVVTDPSNFSLLGRDAPDPQGIGFSRVQATQAGLGSVDNYFARVYLDFGVVGLLVFVLIGLRVASAALIDNLAGIDHAWAAVMLAAFINLMTVSLLTQLAHIFWIGLAVVSGAIARRRAEDSAVADQEALSSPSKL
jgi:hypothetical protein